MKKLTIEKIRNLQKQGLFNLQYLFNAPNKNRELQDFIEENDVCQKIYDLLPKFIDGISKFDIQIGVYSDGSITFS